MRATAPAAEWTYLRGGLLVVAALAVAALAGWGIETAVYEDRAFQETTRCLVDEKRAAVETTRDLIATSAGLGALRTVIETNGVTISVGGSSEDAQRIVAAYRSVANDLGARLEQRGRTVYLWDRSPSPTQRQTLFDCTY